jgi:hypothetical protein
MTNKKPAVKTISMMRVDKSGYLPGESSPFIQGK